MDPEDEVLDLTDAVDEAVEQETPENLETETAEEVEDIGFDGEGDDAPPENSTIRQMRAELAAAKKELAEVRRASAPKVEIGPKPTLESCDYDEDAFEAELLKWQDRKRQAEEGERDAEEQRRRVNEAWQQTVATYERERDSLGIPDAKAAEVRVMSQLNDAQGAVVIKAAGNKAALFVQALDRNPARLSELAKIEDVIELAATIGEMRGKVNMKKRTAPPIDEVATGNASAAGGSDKELDRLEKEAARTGDRTKLIEYKRSLKAS